MEEGCAGLIGILIVIGLVLAVIYMIVVAIGYSLAYIGLTVLLCFDYFATAFTWIGISSPMGGWLVLGCLVGATIGLAKGLKKAGRRSDTWKVYAGAGVLSMLLLLGSYTAATSLNSVNSAPAYVPTMPQPTASPTPMPTRTPRLRNKR